MKKYTRTLDLKALLQKKSFFLFGPRSTGKSFLIKESLGPHAKVINLLKSEDYLELSAHPQNLRERINVKKDKLVVIDEIQKVPLLLNEVHFLIEEYGIHFLMTGSSVRKLRLKDTNLLGGRARRAELFALTFNELENFNLLNYLRFGGLPFILNSDSPREDLFSYVQNYINEEIRLESNVRKIDYFHRFLETAAFSSSELINFANIASDIGVSEPTVKSYFEILEETLIGFQLTPWRKGRSRKAISSSKFYFFDTGVLHTLLRSPDKLEPSSEIFGKTFEQFLAQEIRAFLSYTRKEMTFHFWRSLQKHEVDFVIDNNIAIEVKSSKKIRKEHLVGLKAICDEGSFKKRILVTFDTSEKHIDGIECLHWKPFLEQLWNGDII